MRAFVIYAGGRANRCRTAVDADRAFEMLRDHSQHNGHKLVDIAQAIVDSHLLLLAPVPQPGNPPERPA